MDTPKWVWHAPDQSFLIGEINDGAGVYYDNEKCCWSGNVVCGHQIQGLPDRPTKAEIQGVALAAWISLRAKMEFRTELPPTVVNKD